jgi:hypothetical protein
VGHHQDLVKKSPGCALDPHCGRHPEISLLDVIKAAEGDLIGPVPVGPEQKTPDGHSRGKG